MKPNHVEFQGIPIKPLKYYFSFLIVCSSKMKQTLGTIELNIYANEIEIKFQYRMETWNRSDYQWLQMAVEDSDGIAIKTEIICGRFSSALSKAESLRLWRNPDVGVGKYKKSFKRSLGVEATLDGAFWILILLPFLLLTGEEKICTCYHGGHFRPHQSWGNERLEDLNVNYLRAKS